MFGLLFLTSAVSGAKQQSLGAEPTDPDQYDLSVWNKVLPGVNSGFGSVDLVEIKGLPPAYEVAQVKRLSGWKGERVHCKVLVWSAVADEQVRVEVSDLVSSEDTWKGKIGIGKIRTGTIRAANVKVQAVGFVLTDEFPGGNDRRVKGRIPAHLKPDRIVKTNRLSLGARETRPFWVSIDIPADAKRGVYTGFVSVRSSKGVKRHALSVEVQNWMLPAPEKWSFHLDLWQNPFAVARFHQVPLWSAKHFEYLRPLLKLLANAGQKCVTATLIDKPWGEQVFDSHGSMIRWTKNADGSWSFDYSAFDRYVQLALECGITEQINCYSMVPVGNVLTWFDAASGKNVSASLLPGTAEYEAIWRAFLASFTKHLKEKKWLHKTAIALDEREEDEMDAMFKFLRTVAPELKIAMAGFYYKKLNSSIYDFSSNWHAVKDLLGDPLVARKRAGQKTTFYVACMIPKPNNFTFSVPSESCYEAWYASAQGFDGFLRWAYNSWVEHPEMDSRFVTWPSGDAYLVYPFAQSSIRFERIREGIQDFEKISILREAILRGSSDHSNSDSLLSASFTSAGRRLDSFMATIHYQTLSNRSAADVINEGKKLLFDISNELSD